MEKRKERLRELRHQAYNAEDMLDGCFNEKEFPEIPLINIEYVKILAELNDFIKLLDSLIGD